MKTRRLLSALMTLALLSSLLFAAAAPAAAASDLDSLQAALAAGGTVVLAADIEVPGGTCIEVPEGVTATLDLNGHKLFGGEFEQKDCLLLVGGDLTLTDSAGGGQLSAAYDCVFVVDGCFTMSGGTIADVGMAGVVLNGADARCVIDGGVIADCRGTADEESGGHVSGACVYVIGGNLELRGGTLCDSTYGVYLQGGSAVMTGGEISGIYSVVNQRYGNGECGVGVIMGNDASFAMSGGLISECEFSGIYIFGQSSAEMTGGEISGGLDGVCLNDDEAVFTLTDGALHGFQGMVDGEENYCYYGAGIDIFAGSAEMSGGEIYDALYGIQIGAGCTGSAVMSGGAIHDLHIQWGDDGYYYGGEGIALSNGEFTMTGGTVRDTTCIGVRVLSDAFASVSGGVIDDCPYADISVENGGTLRLSGGPTMDEDDGITLYDGGVITLDGPLTNETPYRVWTDQMGSEETIRFTDGLAGNGGAENFLCYYRTWYAVTVDENGEAVLSYVPYSDDVTVSDWYSLGAAYCMYYGLIDASDGHFDPDATLTRADMAELIWRYTKSPEPDPETVLPYTDVPADAPYAKAIRSLVGFELIGDDGDGLFEPDKPITREMFAFLLYGVTEGYDLGYEGDWSYELYFSDAGEINEAAVEAVCWMVENGVLRGMGDGTLNPGGILTRAQAATMLARLVDAYIALGLYDE